MEGVLEERLERTREGLRRSGLGALLVTDIHNVRYLSGFTGSSAHVIITEEKGRFFTDPRYSAQAGLEVSGLKVKVYKKSWLDEAARFLRGLGLGPIGFEGGDLSHDNYIRLRRSVKPLRLKSAPEVVHNVRLKKDGFEIERIKGSARVLDMGFKEARKLLCPGVLENEAAFGLEIFLRKRGADALAFDTIIASGERGALPHGKAAEKRIKKGDLVVVDMGVLLNGYNSDETRTYCMGRPTRRQREVFGIVLDAQSRAIDKIKAGVPAVEVDKAARASIRKAGYAKYFGHATGHGVGLQVHEGPVIGPLSKEILAEGMVITIEPGIYVPGWGGVRIEDMAVVRSDGCEVLTNSPRELLSL